MDLDKIKNIRGINIESALKEAISTTKNILHGLDESRMCRIYSSLLKNILQNMHVVSRIIDTNDLGFSYGHQFLMVPSENATYPYYLVDLTFSQFQIFNDDFAKLLNDGYLPADNEIFSNYLGYIVHMKNEIKIDDVFYQRK